MIYIFDHPFVLAIEVDVMLVFGGRDSNGQPLGDCHILDLNNMNWKEVIIIMFRDTYLRLYGCTIGFIHY